MIKNLSTFILETILPAIPKSFCGAQIEGGNTAELPFPFIVISSTLEELVAGNSTCTATVEFSVLAMPQVDDDVTTEDLTASLADSLAAFSSADKFNTPSGVNKGLFFYSGLRFSSCSAPITETFGTDNIFRSVLTYRVFVQL